MSTYLERSAESEREHEAKRKEAKVRFGREFVDNPRSNFKPHETPFLTRWLKGEVVIGASDAPGA